MAEVSAELTAFTADFASKMITDNIYTKLETDKKVAEYEEASDLDVQLEKLNKQTKNLKEILNQEEK